MIGGGRIITHTTRTDTHIYTHRERERDGGRGRGEHTRMDAHSRHAHGNKYSLGCSQPFNSSASTDAAVPLTEIEYFVILSTVVRLPALFAKARYSIQLDTAFTSRY